METLCTPSADGDHAFLEQYIHCHCSSWSEEKNPFRLVKDIPFTIEVLDMLVLYGIWQLLSQANSSLLA